MVPCARAEDICRLGCRCSIEKVAMKRCSRCGQDKELSEFNNNRSAKDGKHHYCRICKCKADSEHEARTGREVRRASAKRSYLKHRKSRQERYRNYDRNNKDKRAAYDAVKYALQHGRLTKEPCAICGSTRSQAHHEDYSRPLDVVWLCSQHHMARHSELRSATVNLNN